MTTSLFSQLQRAFPHLLWQAETPLAPFTYMKVGGPAEVLWQAENTTDLVEVVRWCQEHHVALTLLGGASNVLIADEGIKGLVIINRCESVSTCTAEECLANEPPLRDLGEPPYPNMVVAESGIKTALLVRACVDQSLTGLEPFLGVPGTLGGAIFNNSHYTSELIGSYVWAVQVVDNTGNLLWLSQADCQFGYDRSRFHQTRETIVRVVFSLPRGNAEESMEKIKEATVKRATTQPLGTANSGCMFKNVELPPEKRGEYAGKETLSAGWLIDQAGLKGLRVGQAVVSDKHANFIINEGGATAEDIRQLVAQIQHAIRQKFEVELHPEVFFLGQNLPEEESHA